MKRKGLTIKINLTNRWLYTLIAIGILAIVGVGVYAATYTASGGGHPITEISTCTANQVLKMNSDGTAWTCVLSTETDPNVASWAKPAGASLPIVPTGLYGNCYTSATYSCAYGTYVELEPAYCRLGYCDCRSGYTRVLTGQALVSGTTNTYYSCYKT